MKTLISNNPEGIPFLSLAPENEAEQVQLVSIRASLLCSGAELNLWPVGPTPPLVIKLAGKHKDVHS